MSAWEDIGQFMSRRVSVAFFASILDVEVDGSLSSSLVLLHLGGASGGAAELRRALRMVIHSSPLGITVSGAGASEAFRLLLEELENASTLRHVMTKVSTENGFLEAAEDLLTATWPAEECFNEWQAYSFLFVGEDATSRRGLIDDLRLLLESIGGQRS